MSSIIALLILVEVLIVMRIFSLGLYIIFKYSEQIDNRLEKLFSKVPFIRRFIKEA